jgi:hypothetical protein
MGRADRRAIQARHEASLARYRREASNVLRTYLASPDDARLDTVPILRRATRHWLDNLPTRIRSCIVCSSWIPDRHDVGAVLLSTADVAIPKAASICGICCECWRADLPREALEKASLLELRVALPGGHFLEE